jgi:uncharacterized protein YgiM (DUF1202 family)
VEGVTVEEPSGTPAPTATLSSENVTVEQLWVFITWRDANGGVITGWTKPQFLRISDPRGLRIINPPGLLSGLPVVSPTEFGQILSVATPVANTGPEILGTVVIDPGVNLQLRRTPGIDGESLALLPTGTIVTIIARVEVPSQGGVVGEPQSTTWIYVGAQTAQGAFTGWVNSQFLTITRKGQPATVQEVPEAAEIERGGPATAGVVVPPPVQPQPGVATQPPVQAPVVSSTGFIVVVDKVDAGANLHLRRDPNPAAESLQLIPAGLQVPALGRNGDGTWIQVEYQGVQGWVNGNFVSLTRNGQRVPTSGLQNTSGEPDSTPQPQPTVTPTPAS